MVGMYDDIVPGISETITINGIPFFAENINSDEPFNRRELNRTPIQGGTEHISYGKYVPKSFSFSTTIYHPEGRPDVHDTILEEITVKPAEIMSPYMGNFTAEVTFQKNFEEGSPNHYSLDVSITEIATKSNIQGEESFTVPPPKVVMDTKTTTKKTKSNK